FSRQALSIPPHRSAFPRLLRSSRRAFLEKGVLSVPEFILAGDKLVSKCPTWSWEAGDPSKRKPYLPSDKQFLATRNVPCLRRAVVVEEEYDVAGAEVVLDDDEDGEGWLATHGLQPSESKEEEDIPSMDTLDIGKVKWLPLSLHISLQ
uniref:Uncharacterized protein n=2 Tax=Aegilops tauschii subsp. strangulata TaxID=200361 RepID=A0A453ES05_AEGTS